jgi:hypothetical protein
MLGWDREGDILALLQCPERRKLLGAFLLYQFNHIFNS